MKRYFLLLAVSVLSIQAQAQNLTLSDYLRDVKTKNQKARALVSTVQAFKDRVDEGERLTMPYLFGEYNLVDNKKETMVTAFQGDRTRVMSWKGGIKQQTPFGLAGKLYLSTDRTNIHGVAPNFVPQPDYAETAAVLELKQSLWQNGFGAQTRGERDAMNAGNRLQLMQNSFELRNLLIEAENNYWALASFTQIVKLQQQNVERARKLRDWMNSRLKMKLVDDVDAMQAQASLESRELELKASVDERATILRSFQTLRGESTEDIGGELQEFPIQEWLAKPKALPSKPKREDFEMQRAKSEVAEAKARAEKSKLQPKVDLVANFASNGRDASISDSMTEINDGKHPSWMVGVQVEFPLDVGMYMDLNKSYRLEKEAAKELRAQADFEEGRAWADSIQKRDDSQKRFESALSLEKLQEKIVDRERKRLMNGRTTTFQLITQEQTLSAAQIQRVRTQLDFVRTSNSLRIFQERL